MQKKFFFARRTLIGGYMKTISKFLCLLACIGLAACSSSSSDSTTTTPTATGTAADLATFVRWSGASWDAITALMDSSKDITSSTSCSVSGTIDFTDPDTQIQDCVETINGVGYTSAGTYTISVSGSLTTHEWDQSILVDSNNDGTFADDEPSFTTTGNISFDTDDDSTVYDFSAVFPDETLRLTGSATDNGDGTTDTTFWVLLDGDAYQSGQFNNTVVGTLSDDDVDTACSDNTTTTCDTRECSTDFECQLYADDSSTDEFETGNTVCTDGCCAINESAASCPDTSACTGDFDCQLFAENDSTYTCAAAGCCNMTTGCCE